MKLSLLAILSIQMMFANLMCRAAEQPETGGGRPGESNPPAVIVRLLGENGRPSAPQTVAKVVKPDAEWRKHLTQEQYEIARGKGTERPFCGAFHDHKMDGVYLCICCDLPLFASNAKFDSGTGWPSFFQPFAKENVVTELDLSHGMRRTEILCKRCNAHLGHVFDDGPKPTGLRFCLNSASMVFRPAKNGEAAAKP